MNATGQDVKALAVETGRFSKPGLRRVGIAGLATYVPPRVLTNADLEKMVDTTDEWIQQRTGHSRAAHRRSRRRDLRPREGGLARRHRAGRPDARRHRLHRRRHDHAGHDVSEHGVPAPAQDRRDQGVGVRSRRGLLGVHLRADDRGAPGGVGHDRARAGRRRRRDVEHSRLHRSHDLRAVRRRRRRGGRLAVEGARLRHPRLRGGNRRQRRSGALHAGRRQPAAGVAGDGRASVCTS